MRFALIAVIALLVATPVFAADIDGKWTGSVTTAGGEFPVTFTLKADEKKLSGTTTGPDGSEIAIKDGKIDGANVSFSVTLDFGGMPFTIAYKGVLAAEQLKMSADVMGQSMEFVVKKEAAKK
jgi:opacity protein-like surface antigen